MVIAMKRTTRMLITAICIAVLAASWLVALLSETASQKQLRLLRQAGALMVDEVYVPAVPLLEEAAGYDGAHTIAAEEKLKTAYLALIDNRSYSRRYLNLLDRQMARPDAPSEVFAEAAGFYIRIGNLQTALTILRNGIERTQSAALVMLYESERYAYTISRSVFENASPIYNGTMQVRQNGKWGIATADGTTLIPCIYDKVSTYNRERVIVRKNGVIYAVDRNNNRIALAESDIRDFRNFTENRVALLTDGGWLRAAGDFERGSSVFEDIGAYSGGYSAAKVGGRWGVIDTGNDWLIAPEYDEIVQDELGRSYGQGVVFARNGDTVYMYQNGKLLQQTFQDACPFSDEGYAAACQNGKWGFIDTDGNFVIEPMFDDALSFGTHLAAVKTGDLWGYINLGGNLVIDAIFIEAKSFAGGSAPVLTQKGWQIITLTEYKKERALLS